MINWPCILKLEGDDELIYLDSMEQLNSECNELICSHEDKVIDCEGYVYFLNIDSRFVELKRSPNQISAQEASQLIQSHEFCRAQVCLTKIQFESVSDAIYCLKP